MRETPREKDIKIGRENEREREREREREKGPGRVLGTCSMTFSESDARKKASGAS